MYIHIYTYAYAYAYKYIVAYYTTTILQSVLSQDSVYTNFKIGAFIFLSFYLLSIYGICNIYYFSTLVTFI